MSTTHRNLLRAAILASLAAAPVYAQSDNSGPIGEIIVTAERRDAALQDVPLAVSALSSEQVENLQITEAADLQRVVPSLHMFNNITSPTNLSLSLRGGLQQDASLVVAESPVGIYVDDVFVGRLNGNNTTLSDIERIEVLRGPQGTLYGRNTGYGAVKYISRTPGDEGWFNTTIGAGDYDQYLFKTSVGGPLSENVAGSMALQWKHKADQYTNAFEGVETGEEESLAMRGKFKFTLSDSTTAVFSVAHSDTDHDSLQLSPASTPGDPDNESQFTTDDLSFAAGEFATLTPWGELSPGPLRDRPQGETKQTIVGVTFNWDVNDDTTIKYITGLVKTEDFFHTDFSGVGFIQGATEVESEQFTQEVQVLGSAFGDSFDYIVGAFFLSEDADQRFGWYFGAPLSESVIKTDISSIAAFTEVNWHITDSLTLTGGLRWTDDSKDFRFDYERLAGNFFDTVIAPGFFPATVEQINLEGDFDEWTPKLGINWAVNDDLLFYLQGAEGYKGGGFSAIALGSTFPVGVYDPETNLTIETGMKADWLGQRLRTNLAYFYSWIEDIQQNATVAGAGFEFPVQNSGDAEIQGLEFEITAVPFDGLNVFLSGALMDGKYTDLNPNSAAAAARTLYGVEPGTPQTPDYTISVGFDYTFDFWGEAIGDVSIGADYYEIDEYITAATNDFKNSGWDIWNAFISADIGNNLELKLTGKNLGDDFIVTAGSRALGGFISLPPREVMLSLTYRYGE